MAPSAKVCTVAASSGLGCDGTAWFLTLSPLADGAKEEGDAIRKG